MGNIYAKKCQNAFTCVKVIANQRWDLRCGEVFYYCFARNLLLCMRVKGVWKSISTWQSQTQKYSGTFFLDIICLVAVAVFRCWKLIVCVLMWTERFDEQEATAQSTYTGVAEWRQSDKWSTESTRRRQASDATCSQCHSSRLTILSVHTQLIMAALCSRAGHYIFILSFVFYLLSFFFFWMSAILPHMVWP